MKNFIEYLTESEKTYEFKIKFANVDPTDKLDCIEACLSAYHLDNSSKPKSLPITESHIDFPSFKSPEVWVMEVAVKYPVAEHQLKALIAERLGVGQGNLFVVAKNHPEEQWREGEGELKEYKQGEAVLDKDYEDTNAEQKEAGEAYAKATSLLKELSTPKVEVAGEETPEAETTNDLPEGTESPVGSNQNKIPDAK